MCEEICYIVPNSVCTYIVGYGYCDGKLGWKIDIAPYLISLLFKYGEFLKNRIETSEKNGLD